MTAREIICELEKQKAILGESFFDPELLEKYLTLSAKKEEDIMDIDIYGIEDLQSINNQLNKIYPYATEKPNFNRARGNWYQLYKIARKTGTPVTMTVRISPAKQYRKLPVTNNYDVRKAA